MVFRAKNLTKISEKKNMKKNFQNFENKLGYMQYRVLTSKSYGPILIFLYDNIPDQ